MLRENTDCFLDDLSLKDVEKEIGKPIRVVSNGESLIRALYGMEDNHD
jgi:NifB/MoaA-like Fe-S oxidoreductase